MSKMEIDTNDSATVGIGKAYPYAFFLSVMYKVFFTEAIHWIGTAIGALLLAVLLYMANNFWIPYLFPKQGKWKAFNFLRPRK